jgi:hypothetical protein
LTALVKIKEPDQAYGDSRGDEDANEYEDGRTHGAINLSLKKHGCKGLE